MKPKPTRSISEIANSMQRAIFFKSALIALVFAFPLSLSLAIYIQTHNATAVTSAIESQLSLALQTGDTFEIRKIVASVGRGTAPASVVVQNIDRTLVIGSTSDDSRSKGGFSPTKLTYVFERPIKSPHAGIVGYLMFNVRFNWIVYFSVVAILLVPFTISQFWLRSSWLSFMKVTRSAIVSLAERISDPARPCSNIDEIDNAYNEISRLNNIENSARKLEILLQNKEQNYLTAKRVAHDIRSPLTALTIVAKKMVHVPETHRDLILASVQRISEIATDLLDQADIEKRRAHCSSESKLSLSTHIANLVSEKRMTIPNGKSISIEPLILDESMTLPEKLPMKEFIRILSNLINNSVEAISQTGKITLSVQNTESSMKTTITDTGIGIPQSLQRHIGKIGFTTKKYDKNSTLNGGCGIGLSSAKSLIESLGGTFSIISEINHGTQVSFQIPLANRNRSLEVLENSTGTVGSKLADWS